MSHYTDYVERLAERYGTLERVDQASVSWEQGYVPLCVQQGPVYAKRELEQFHDSLIGARRRVREEEIKELLNTQPEFDLLWEMPYGSVWRVEEIAERESRLVLLGGAGAGKTTALHYLASHPLVSSLPLTREGESEKLVTLLIDLPTLTDSPLAQYLAEDAQQHLSLSVPAEFFEDLLARGRAVLCLDGLSQIPSQSRRNQVVQKIESWVQEYPHCRYIIAVRPDAYEPSLNTQTFAHYGLIPWNDAVVADLERAWNEALDGWKVQDAKQAYYAQRHPLWQQLALVMHEHGRISASLEEAQEWLAEAAVASKAIKLNKRRAPEEVRALLEGSIPQLRFVQQQDGQVSFAPRLLQDILAARALEALGVDGSVNALWGEIEPHLSTPEWRQALILTHRFLAQDHPDVWSKLTSRGLDAKEEGSLEPILHRYLFVAASALAGGMEGANEAVRKSIVDGLFNWMNDTAAAGHKKAVDALFGLGAEPYAVQRVLEGARDSMLDPYSREACLLLLGHMGQSRPDDAVEALENCIDDAEEAARLRYAATTALGALAHSGALSDESQARAEARLLERIRNPELPIGLRVAVGEALGLVLREYRREEILEAFVELAQGKNGEEKVPYSVQNVAAQELCFLLPIAGDSAFVERMWELARDEKADDSVRCCLTEALGKLGDKDEAARILIGIAKSAQVYPPGQRDALDALGRLGHAPESVIDEIVEIAESEDRKVKDFVRLAAARALGYLGDIASAVQHMLMLVADKSIYRTTRMDALAYLSGMGSSGDQELDDAVIAVLQIWLAEENTTEDVRERAMDSLIELRVDREDVLKDVAGVIQDKHTYPRVRRTTADALYRMPVQQKELVVEALSPVFYDPEETSDLLRVPIARMLYTWSQDEVALNYLKDVADRSYMALARYKAAMILGNLGEMELAVVTLLKLAEDAEIADTIRVDSLRALGLWTVGNEAVEQAIIELLQEEALPNVREAACEALGSISAA